MLRATLLALCLATAPAAAQGPLAREDFAVTMQVEGPDGSRMTSRLSYRSAQGLVRAEMLESPFWVVLSIRDRTGFVVNMAERSITRLPAPLPGTETAPSGDWLTERHIGASRVLGEDCTEWEYTATALSFTACVTEDGVPLRMAGSAAGLTFRQEAGAVQREAQDPARFRPPEGFTEMPAAR